MSLVTLDEVEYWEKFFALNYSDNPKLQIFGVTPTSILIQLRISREYEVKMGQRLKIICKETGEMCAAFRMCRLSERIKGAEPTWDLDFMRSYQMN